MNAITRRIWLKLSSIGGAWLGVRSLAISQEPTSTNASAGATVAWADTPDRVWIGSQIWANPMEDWRVVDGAAECQNLGGGNRNLHLLTHQITNPDGAIETTIRVRKVESKTADGGAGFRLGIRSELNEHRSNCFAKSGINAGVIGNAVVLGDKRTPIQRDPKAELSLKLKGGRRGEDYRLTLSVHSGETRLGQLSHDVPADAIVGNIALVNHFAARSEPEIGGRYQFRDWSVSGDAFSHSPQHRFGPILWAMYSLSDSRTDEGFVMKISALTGPLGAKDNKQVELLVMQNDAWKSLGWSELDPDAWTATFRIPHWNEKSETPYRLVYRQRHRDGSESEHDWKGIIKANPADRPLRLGALTCQKDYGFPYEPVVTNLIKLDPDMLYFSGDQLYEDHGGYGLIRRPADRAILNYLRKYYLFGWAFRDAMRDRPTLCIPDDHDVFQGNLWGEGGAAMAPGVKGASSNGGYIEPVRMVNVVHRTNTAHHPDFHDPQSAKRGISVYYGDMVYGGVGFAILADRQFKSGPEHVDTGAGRADHVQDVNFDMSQLDKPGLQLLGQRQESFLEAWADDWRGHSMKVLLSQTVLAGVATHHGGYDSFLKADLDSGGWPQAARNRAIEIIRKAKPLHINGDQHLTSLVQYGVARQRDGGWSFCTPAISAGYPRWWRPDELGMQHANRPRHGLPDTGEFLDSFGNRVYVYAVGNPEVGTKPNRYERAHQKGSGFGLVTIDSRAKTYMIEAFRFLVDATEARESNQFPGWPVTIEQKENGGENLLG